MLQDVVPQGVAVLGVALLVTVAGCAPAETEADALAQASATVASPAPSPEPSAESLITETPDEAAQVGSLVPGFPTDLLPVPADAVLLVTSAVPVAADAQVQEVSLNLTTRLSTDDVLTLYRTSLTTAGFTEVEAADTGLTAEASFVRSDGDELVSVGVLDDDGARTVTIGGRVRIAAQP